MAKDFLLEIGTEEIAARFMPGAIKQLKELAENIFREKRLNYKSIDTYGTPRRLTLVVSGLDEAQAELVEEVKGPAKKAAFDAEGKPTKAAEGFARGQGVSVADLVVKDTGSGEYVFATRKEAGRATGDILPEICPGLITGLSFPKPMRWGYNELRFARPIRWLVALYGEEVVNFELEGLKAGRETLGHRFLSQGAITINNPGEYLPKLEEGFVIVDHRKRQSIIWEQIQALAKEEGGIVEPDEGLLEEVTFLLEYPTALCGKFEVHYLELPKEVLITPMREHQRYFPVIDANGKLLAKFITVRNGGGDYLDIVRAGNEKVLKARLADARFFYQEDLKKPLAENVERLKKIVFQESLGTIYQKVERIIKLVEYLAAQTAAGAAETEAAKRAAYLAKADLVSNMVYEFPELQGIMGEEYARKSGEPEGVAKAIVEHYRPRFAGDGLPETVPGTLVSIADKIDTIVGCFAVGIIPTGSQDPYALRRQALGISHIILDKGYGISLQDLVTQAYRGYEGNAQLKLTLAEVQNEIIEFFKARLKNIFTDKGLRYDEIDAVLAVGHDNFADAWLRAEALSFVRQQPYFEALLTAFNRATNLAKKAESDNANPANLVEEVEKELFNRFQAARQEVEALRSRKDYRGLLQTMAQLQQPIDNFFNGVMVMAEDPAIRNNRLGLLKQIDDLMYSVADLAKIAG
ncbi:MAG: glycine--tRNA ligase subunit beta [Clostridia bacterium]|nr:glycine--tRNA ligase subunit beta [Clostridia bacterium]